MSEGTIATVALDCFHENIGIEFLEDFDIRVVDADGHEIAEIEAHAGPENEFEGGATFYGKVDDLDLNDEASSPRP